MSYAGSVIVAVKQERDHYVVEVQHETEIPMLWKRFAWRDHAEAEATKLRNLITYVAARDVAV